MHASCTSFVVFCWRECAQIRRLFYNKLRVAIRIRQTSQCIFCMRRRFFFSVVHFFSAPFCGSVYSQAGQIEREKKHIKLTAKWLFITCSWCMCDVRWRCSIKYYIMIWDGQKGAERWTHIITFILSYIPFFSSVSVFLLLFSSMRSVAYRTIRMLNGEKIFCIVIFAF